MTRTSPDPVRAVRRWGGDPLAPFLLLAVGTLAAAAYGNVLTWAMVGGLAGYTLSGSV
ncbi:hypothetical protein [Micromonospora sp. CA-111912]|uniref:hypothetical protein n=1 Tax=Micromonospora sp. CA-111912 TaxID=3239955 RepID=UPI003D8BD15A